MNFIGRESELEQLSTLWGKLSSTSLVTVRGRRRIGKSTLVAEFARRSKARFLKIEGLSLRTAHTNDDELRAFYSQLQLISGKTYQFGDWLKAFHDLDAEIRDNERTVVLLDEISWMGHFDEKFSGLLKIAWDNFFHRHPKLILFFCGSVSSWISENILKDGAFLGRPSADIVLRELPVFQCLAFWGKQGAHLSRREFLDMLSVTGGVPRYLEEIRPACTTDENLRLSCFSSTGYLFKDFDQMFGELFDEGVQMRKTVLEKLAENAMNVSQLAEALGKNRSGHLTQTLRELKEAGFVAAERGNNPETGKRRQEVFYRVSDNYVRFYLRIIKARAEAIRDDAYRFESLEQMPGWDTILGLQFENLVLSALPALVRILHLDRSRIDSMAPFRKTGDKKTGERGCQIDCLIQTKRSLYVVEIKRQREIGPEVIDEVEEKIRRLPHASSLSVRPVLVYDGELRPSVMDENYFTACISSDELFGLKWTRKEST